MEELAFRNEATLLIVGGVVGAVLASVTGGVAAMLRWRREDRVYWTQVRREVYPVFLSDVEAYASDLLSVARNNFGSKEPNSAKRVKIEQSLTVIYMFGSPRVIAAAEKLVDGLLSVQAAMMIDGPTSSPQGQLQRMDSIWRQWSKGRDEFVAAARIELGNSRLTPPLRGFGASHQLEDWRNAEAVDYDDSELEDQAIVEMKRSYRHDRGQE